MRFLQILLVAVILLIGASFYSVAVASPAVTQHVDSTQPAKSVANDDTGTVVHSHATLTEGASGQISFAVPWQVVDAGGMEATDGHFTLTASVGQSNIGLSDDPGQKLGSGYWYGCTCPYLGDPLGDGVIDVFDVIAIIEVAFSGRPPTSDTFCPVAREDFNADGVVDVFDVIAAIEHAFNGGPDPVDACLM